MNGIKLVRISSQCIATTLCLKKTSHLYNLL